MDVSSNQQAGAAVGQPDITDLIRQGHHAEAEALLLRMLVEQPDSVWALTRLGVVYRSTKRRPAAEACYRRAIGLAPRDAGLHSNFANVLVDLDRYDEAISHARKAVELDASSVLFRKNLAAALREAKLLEEAVEHYRWCLDQEPDDKEIQLSLAIVLLHLRQLDEGWDRFDCRFQDGILLPHVGSLPRWEGEDLQGKRLLLTAEQGFGDTMLMTRFLPELADRGAKISLVCKMPLHGIFSSLPATLLTEDRIVPADYDYFAPLMHLPVHLGRDWLDWPAPPQWHVSQAARDKYAFLSQATPKRLRVGIVWSGSTTFQGNAKRSVDFSRFLQLSSRLPEIQFYSFQKGPCEQDLADQGAGTILPLGQSFDSFDDTAAAALQMDCIVMTDSALVHLAGGLGVPVLDLLPFMPYWLYFPEKPTTPLYPSVRFLRQATPGDWPPLFDTVKISLENLASAKPIK